MSNDTLPVSEYFETIQGEATHAGRPSVFIRMQGCPVGCPWCDTVYSWHLDQANEVGADEIVLKDGAHSKTWAVVGVEDLIGVVRRCRARHVVLTGGEPCLYDLTELSGALLDEGYSVQVETSGTQPIRIDPRAWVTLSPKVGMPGGYEVRADAMTRADELKMPIGRPDDLQTLFHLLGVHGFDAGKPIWLQPLSRSQKATQLCYQAAIANNFRVSLQLHAYAGWR